MGFLSVLSFAHKQIEGRLAPGDIAVDATVGTGADTAFLAKAAGLKAGCTASIFKSRRFALPRNGCPGSLPAAWLSFPCFLQATRG